MKFLAILRDSLREAIDTKVFYVLVGLSGLLVLLVASLSFRPLSVQEQVQGFTRLLSFVNSFASQGSARPRFEITDFEQLNEAREPWLGNYRFAFVIKMPDEKDGKDAADARKAGNVPVRQLREGFHSVLPWVDKLEVTHVESTDPNEVRYLVTTEGSKIDDPRHWTYEPSLFFGAVPLPFFQNSLSGMVYRIEDTLVNGFGAWIGILVGVVITAFFIPNMLRKGTVDLLVAKPIHRTTLLLYKYVGGLSFIFLTSAVAVTSMWVALGLRSGIWATGFLLTILIITFFFAILYAVSTLFGVLTRSPIVAIMMTVVVWFVLWLVGQVYAGLEVVRKDSPEVAEKIPQWVYTSTNALHFVLPRTSDLDLLTTRLLSREVLTESEIKARKLDLLPAPNWAESLTISGIFVALMLGAACWWFATKDY